MKTVKSQLKRIAVFLSFLLFLQSCSANYTGSYTLLDAYNSKREVRITTINNKKFEYKKIDSLNGQFVGQIYTNNNQIVNEPLNAKAITKVEFKRNKEASSKEGLIILGVIAGAVLGIIVIVSAVNSADLNE